MDFSDAEDQANNVVGVIDTFHSTPQLCSYPSQSLDQNTPSRSQSVHTGIGSPEVCLGDTSSYFLVAELLSVLAATMECAATVHVLSRTV